MRVLHEAEKHPITVDPKIKELKGGFAFPNNYDVLRDGIITPYIHKYGGKYTDPFIKYLQSLQFSLKGKLPYVNWIMQNVLASKYLPSFFSAKPAQDEQLFDNNDRDFKYITNLISVLYDRNKVKEYVSGNPTQSEIKDVFYDGANLRKAGIKSEDPDSIYQKVEEISQSKGRTSNLSDLGEPQYNETVEDCVQYFIALWNAEIGEPFSDRNVKAVFNSYKNNKHDRVLQLMTINLKKYAEIKHISKLEDALDALIKDVNFTLAQ